MPREPPIKFHDLTHSPPSWSDLCPAQELADKVRAKIDTNVVSGPEVGARVLYPILKALGWESDRYEIRLGRESGAAATEATLRRYPTLLPVNATCVEPDVVVVEHEWAARPPRERDYPIIAEIKEPDATNPRDILKKAVKDAVLYVGIATAKIGVVSNGRFIGVVLPLRHPQQALVDCADSAQLKLMLTVDALLDRENYAGLLGRAGLAYSPEAVKAFAETITAATRQEVRPVEEIPRVLNQIYQGLYERLQRLDRLMANAHLSTAREAWTKIRESMPKEMRTVDTFWHETAYDATIKLFALKVSADQGLLREAEVGDALYDDAPAGLTTFVRRALGTAGYSPALGFNILSWWIPTADQMADLAARRADVEGVLAEVSGLLDSGWAELSRFQTKNLDRDQIGAIYERHIPIEKRRKLGEYYTSTRVVNYLLTEVKYGMANLDHRQIRLLDPACGSGSFLVRAARALRSAMEVSEGFDAEDPHHAAELLDLVGSRLVGLDINPFAVDLSKLNLFLSNIDLIRAAAEGEEVKSVDFKVFQTDSLKRGSEALGPLDAFLATRHNHRFERERRVIQSSEDAKGASYDFVVGNPPYASRFQVSGYARVLNQYGVDNVAYAFWKRAISTWCRQPSGRVGFVMPMDFTFGWDARELTEPLLSRGGLQVTAIHPRYYDEFYRKSKIGKVTVVWPIYS